MIKTGNKYHKLTAIKPSKRKTFAGNYYWWFECDCGNIKEILPSNIIKKKGCIKSCGCLLKSKQHRNGILHQLMWDYKIGAKKRGLEYLLTEKQFVNLISKPCKYCGTLPSQIRKQKNRQLVYNGIDRADNTKGYTLDNCVSCCKVCNYMKRNFTEEQFLNHIKKILTMCTVSSVV